VGKIHINKTDQSRIVRGEHLAFQLFECGENATSVLRDQCANLSELFGDGNFTYCGIHISIITKPGHKEKKNIPESNTPPQSSGA
ncbi:MAG: hypothetical protein IK016_09425, partial [Lachnospiraceae bacterium]|nr:hypothetical protein [Lachnospiraceae bacterium]